MRHIVRIDIKNNALVKGINLEGLRVLGDPIDAAQLYYQQGCEELFIVDVVASLYGRNALQDFIRTVSDNVFVPITVAGGIRNEKDVETLLKAGADRVAINSAFTVEPDLIATLSRKFGRSTICGMIEGVKISDDDIKCFTCSGREETDLDLYDWAHVLEDQGVGEIIYTDVIAEGTGQGLDIETIRRLSGSLSVPLVVNGGIGKIDDVQEALLIKKLSGVSVASCIHYSYLSQIKGGADVLGNAKMRASAKAPPFIQTMTIPEFNAVSLLELEGQ